jgi:hypothetical protein
MMLRIIQESAYLTLPVPVHMASLVTGAKTGTHIKKKKN